MEGPAPDHEGATAAEAPNQDGFVLVSGRDGGATIDAPSTSTALESSTVRLKIGVDIGGVIIAKSVRARRERKHRDHHRKDRDSHHRHEKRHHHHRDGDSESGKHERGKEDRQHHHHEKRHGEGRREHREHHEHPRHERKAREGEDTSFFGENFLLTPPVEGAFEALHALVQAFGAENVFLVSKAGVAIQQKTNQWLEGKGFWEQTGLLPKNLNYCIERKEKVDICQRLGVNVFIDDTLEVLKFLSKLPMERLFWFVPDRQTTRSPNPQFEIKFTWDEVVRSLTKEEKETTDPELDALVEFVDAAM